MQKVETKGIAAINAAFTKWPISGDSPATQFASVLPYCPGCITLIQTHHVFDLSGTSLRLVQILLEAGEDLPNLLRSSQVGQGIGNGVVVFEPQQGRELLLIQLLDPDTSHGRGQDASSDARRVHVGRAMTDGHPSGPGLVPESGPRSSLGQAVQHPEFVDREGMPDPPAPISVLARAVQDALGGVGEHRRETRPRLTRPPHQLTRPLGITEADMIADQLQGLELRRGPRLFMFSA